MSESAPILPPDLRAWVDEIAAHTKPSGIHFCNGSDSEYQALLAEMQSKGSLIPLNSTAHPDSYLHRSHPSDVARTEHLTFIATPSKEDAGPNNNWLSPAEVEARIWPLFAGAMKGRVLYVVPYLMGPAGSSYSRVGVQLTDSPYVVASLRIMTRMGDIALRHLDPHKGFVRGIHSLGDLSPDRRYIVHVPQTRTILSIGSGYGGNALLSKKCHALRIASVEGRRDGWLAEHMLILGITNPLGEKRYIAAAFPSACGKTNLAMLVPSLPGWKIETVGDDICWMHVGSDGRLWAINPEAGMFGVAPGTSQKSNPNALRALSHKVLFTNVALRKDGRVYWEGLEALPEDESLIDWRGQPWQPGCGTPAAHPNSRFTVSLPQCPSVGTSYDDPQGVPISAILFGGRRASTMPLVFQAYSFRHGVYVGATMASETTAAATGAVGVLRRDPMAMLPFCGYNMGDYFAHWLRIGRKLAHPPRIFHVNWFRTDRSGRYLWPGFGDNIRVLEWIFGRIDGQAHAVQTAIGHMPAAHDLNLSGLNMSQADLAALLALDHSALLRDAGQSLEFLSQFGSHLPRGLVHEHCLLVQRLSDRRNLQLAARPSAESLH
ncbi:MAG TPA: phosphoenolpyruvate carboxykinase (GTP) [Pseudomonadota bacterium]|nr:phosphoenolpyruvate carboxykinase (GTP) [Pseudomonadota bacterium]